MTEGYFVFIFFNGKGNVPFLVFKYVYFVAFFCTPVKGAHRKLGGGDVIPSKIEGLAFPIKGFSTESAFWPGVFYGADIPGFLRLYEP